MTIDKDGYIIAEIGNNHDGEYNKAIKLVEEAKQAGANCVKFQCIKYDRWVDSRLEVFARAKNTGYKTQLERLKAIELTVEEYKGLAEICYKVGIDFACTIFDKEVMQVLNKYLSFAKVSSGEIHNKETLEVAKSSGKQVVISTGLTRNINDVSNAIDYINKEDTYIMHCVSRYPSTVENYEWQNLSILQEIYGENRVGLSDHTCGILASILSIGKGCKVIERHFKLEAERGEEGDKKLSLRKDELNKIVNIMKILAVTERKAQSKEYSNNCQENKSWQQLVRKAHSKKEIKKGDTIYNEDISYKISGLGLYTSFDFDKKIVSAVKNIRPGEALDGTNISVA